MPIWLLANKKLLAQGGAIIAVLVGLYQLHDSIYESGITACKIESSKVFNERVLKMQSDTVKQVQAALDLQTLDYASDIERAKNERVIVTKTEVVKEYVTNTIEVPSACAVVAADVVRVLINATSIINDPATSGDTSPKDQP
tara:strand:- start:130 stop:555 length:426 start_codon:yes stop_codon:yes gene_type:complete